MLARSSILWRPSLHRHYPTSSLHRPPSQDRGPLPRCLFGLLWHTPNGWPPLKNPSDPPGSFLVSMCCSMPSATPGRGIDHSSYRDRSYCLLQLRKLRPSQLRVFRGYLPDSASIASPRNLPPLLASVSGGLTKTFPRGVPTHTTKNHFQVQPQPPLLG